MKLKTLNIYFEKNLANNFIKFLIFFIDPVIFFTYKPKNSFYFM